MSTADLISLTGNAERSFELALNKLRALGQQAYIAEELVRGRIKLDPRELAAVEGLELPRHHPFIVRGHDRLEFEESSVFRGLGPIIFFDARDEAALLRRIAERWAAEAQQLMERLRRARQIASSAIMIPDTFGIEAEVSGPEGTAYLVFTADGTSAQVVAIDREPLDPSLPWPDLLFAISSQEVLQRAVAEARSLLAPPELPEPDLVPPSLAVPEPVVAESLFELKLSEPVEQPAFQGPPLVLPPFLMPSMPPVLAGASVPALALPAELPLDPVAFDPFADDAERLERAFAAAVLPLSPAPKTASVPAPPAAARSAPAPSAPPASSAHSAPSTPGQPARSRPPLPSPPQARRRSSGPAAPASIGGALPGSNPPHPIQSRAERLAIRVPARLSCLGAGSRVLPCSVANVSAGGVFLAISLQDAPAVGQLVQLGGFGSHTVRGRVAHHRDREEGLLLGTPEGIGVAFLAEEEGGIGLRAAQEVPYGLLLMSDGVPRQRVVNALLSEGCQLLVAENLAAASAAFFLHAISVVLFDERVNGGRWLDAADALGLAQRAVPIVLVTAGAEHPPLPGWLTAVPAERMDGALLRGVLEAPVLGQGISA